MVIVKVELFNTYGSGIEIRTSFNSSEGCSRPYSMLTSHPLGVSLGQQLTEITIHLNY